MLQNVILKPTTTNSLELWKIFFWNDLFAPFITGMSSLISHG